MFIGGYSLDMDVLDPEEAPANQSLLPGGLSVNHVEEAIDMALKKRFHQPVAEGHCGGSQGDADARKNDRQTHPSRGRGHGWCLFHAFSEAYSLMNESTVSLVVQAEHSLRQRSLILNIIRVMGNE